MRLATHRLTSVRTAVIARDDVPLAVLEQMTEDADAPVAYAARARIGAVTATRPDEDPHPRKRKR